MKKWVMTWLACLFLAVPGIRAEAGGFTKTKIAVLDFNIQGAGIDPDMGKIVAEWLITALVKDGRFEVIERRLLESIINEQKLVMSGVVDPRNAEELGRLLGVQVIITGSIMKFQDVMEANARIIDVKDASIIAAESVQSSTAVKLEDMVKQMAEKIISDFPLQGYVVSISDQTVTLDLGQVSGVKPGMQFSVFKEGRVIKHPKTGEVLDVERLETAVIEIVSVGRNTSVARIVSRAEGTALEYGQQVSSLTTLGSLVPSKTPSPPVAAAPAVPARTPEPARPEARSVAVQEARAAPLPNSLLARVASDDSATKVRAVKEIARQRTVDPETLDALERELRKGYQIKQNDRYHVDALSWCCTILGKSGNVNYLPVLNEVAERAPSEKLRGYAAKGAAQLQRRR